MMSASASASRPRSKTNSSDATVPEALAVSSVSNASYEYRQIRTFGTQAADSRDWRSRRTHQRSSNQRGSESTSSASAASKKQWRRSDKSQGKNLDQDDDHKVSGEISGSPNQRLFNRMDFEQDSSDSLVSEKEDSKIGGRYEVMKHLYLNALMKNDRHLSLIQVTPHRSDSGSYSPSVLVDIEPLGKESQASFGVADNSQDEQLTAALHAADSTPRKVRVNLISESQRNMAIDNSLRKNECRIQRTRSENPTRASARDKSSRERPLASGHHSDAATQSSPRSVTQIEKEKAFQRILERLAVKSSQQQQIALRQQRDGGYEENSGVVQTHKAEAISELRHPIQGIKRRMGMASEPVSNQVCIRKIIHKKEGTDSSADSAIVMGDTGKAKSLNPKAREFLSFRNNDSTDVVGTRAHTTQSFQLQPPAGTGGQIPQFPHELPSNSFTVQPSPPYKPMPTGASEMAPSIALNSFLAGNVLPLTAGPFQDQLAIARMAIPPASVLPPPLMLQPIAGNIMSIPPTTVVNAALPVVGPLDPAILAPSCPFPLTGAASRPQPVPKPRRPDPGDQQAYEAWVEWRKANEPGYALECRLRQQRRAQRNTMEMPAKVPPGKKSGVASEA